MSQNIPDQTPNMQPNQEPRVLDYHEAALALGSLAAGDTVTFGEDNPAHKLDLFFSNAVGPHYVVRK